jgi:hypothetical protein
MNAGNGERNVEGVYQNLVSQYRIGGVRMIRAFRKFRSEELSHTSRLVKEERGWIQRYGP